MSRFREAGEAVTAEYRRCSGRVQLHCRGAERDPDAAGIWRIDVGARQDFDWTWEGATASGVAGPNTPTWSGEVVELDRSAGYLFVAIAEGAEPTAGPFQVQPFGFLECLQRLFTADEFRYLEPPIERSLGFAAGVPPPVIGAKLQGGGIAQLSAAWSHCWSLLWGPPGTGKTFTIGIHVASLKADSRTLVVSTTNRATDEAALAIGRALSQQAKSIKHVRRIGSGADIRRYESEGLEGLLSGTASELRRLLAAAIAKRDSAHRTADRAALNSQIQELRRQLSASASVIDDSELSVIVATAHQAALIARTEAVRGRLGTSNAPFESIILDEAGLISRAAAAALGQLAAKRVMLVGDPRQLAPISRMSRILPSRVGQWIGSSALSHLTADVARDSHVHLLAEQHRMHSDIRAAVSDYQYGGALRDSPAVAKRAILLDKPLKETGRCIWFVLDEFVGGDRASARAKRGPGNRSWTRDCTTAALDRIASAHPQMRDGRVLYLSPFTAQVQRVREHLADGGAAGRWRSSTVHSQQGAEEDYVILDTVNACSTGWLPEEWRRLVNVGLSRARHVAILLATRAEMEQPFLAPLARLLEPRSLERQGGAWRWVSVPSNPPYVPPAPSRSDGSSLGAQIARRKELRPVLSFDQERLCQFDIRGGARVVRGVAGSGKTRVLAEWLVRTLASPDFQGKKAWVVFANKSLEGLIRSAISEAWRSQFADAPFPEERLELHWAQGLLDDLLVEVGGRPNTDDSRWDLEAKARGYLIRHGGTAPNPRCEALFLDEAQDFGHVTLGLMFGLVERADGASPRVFVFYDNAQNVFGRATPNWGELGIDVRGRSVIMKESFRSTRPITEFSLNTLYRLWPPEKDPENAELARNGLIEKTLRNKRPWWLVHFCEVDGPRPEFRRFTSDGNEADYVVATVTRWISEEAVTPCDIKVIVNGQASRRRLVTALQQAFANSPVAVREIQAGAQYPKSQDVLVVTTSHGFKGYDAEIVCIPSAQDFVARGVGTLHHALYVAMTRARSVLHVSAVGAAGDPIIAALETSLADLGERPTVQQALSPRQLLEDILDRYGRTPRSEARLLSLAVAFDLQFEPIRREDGSVIAEPLFWFASEGSISACLGNEDISTAQRDELQDRGVRLIDLE